MTPAPTACRHCPVPEREHGLQYTEAAGWHQWTEPTGHAAPGPDAGPARTTTGDDVTATIRPSQFEVSVLPEDDINYPYFVVTVEARGGGRWAVVRHRQCLGSDGEWSWESIPSEREDEWLATHRFDLETAQRLAIEAAPGIHVNGMTAAQALARKATP